MFKLNNNIQLEQLIPYMLLKENDKNYNNKNKNMDEIKIKKLDKINSKKLAKVNYNELYCKYNNKYNGSYYREKKHTQYDCLFWCFFDIYCENYSEEYYLNLNSNKSLKSEKDFKLKFIETLRDNRSILKQNNLKLSSLEVEFSSTDKISLGGFHALSVLYDIPFIIAKDNMTYYRFNFTLLDIEDVFSNNNSKDIHIIWFKDGKYNIEQDVTVEMIDDIVKKYYYIKNYNKPLTSISSYKVDDLVEIALQLNINIYRDQDKKRYIKKQEMYETIYKTII